MQYNILFFKCISVFQQALNKVFNIERAIEMKLSGLPMAIELFAPNMEDFKSIYYHENIYTKKQTTHLNGNK